jgi:hypothetical protein
MKVVVVMMMRRRKKERRACHGRVHMSIRPIQFACHVSTCGL